MSTGLGERLKKKRKELGLSQEELAKRLGLKSKSTICKIERGDDNLTTTAIRKYANALNVEPGYLMGWEEVEVQAVTDEERIKAERLYDLYTKSSLEVQQAVELMLKSSQQKS